MNLIQRCLQQFAFRVTDNKIKIKKTYNNNNIGLFGSVSKLSPLRLGLQITHIILRAGK